LSRTLVNGPVTLLWGLERDRYNHRKVLCDSAVGQGVEALLQAAVWMQEETGRTSNTATWRRDVTAHFQPTRTIALFAMASRGLVVAGPEARGVRILRPP
jgi:hypothetical protein